MFSKLKNEVKYFSQIFGIPIYALSHLKRRDKNLWVFGSTFGKRFADNPRYFFYYVSQMDDEERRLAYGGGGKQKDNPEKKVRPVWITKSPALAKELTGMGYEAYWNRSKEGMYCCINAGVYIFDNYSKDISFWLSGGAKKFNLWHGTPLKKIQMDNNFDKVRHPENNFKRIYWLLRRMSDEKPGHYVLTTSEFFRPIFSSAFATKNVLVCGYPRNDSLFEGAETNTHPESAADGSSHPQSVQKACIKNDLLPGEKRRKGWLLANEKKNPGLKIISYMPTFRDSETIFFDKINLKELSEYLEEKNACMVIKLHPKSKLQEMFRKKAGEQGIKKGRILLLSNKDDPYEFLKMSHALITDYSSVYFDYLILDRPVIFFDYDLKEYLSESRELYFDYDEFTPGRKAGNWEELKGALEKIDWEKGTDGFEHKRMEIRRLAIDEPDFHASRRLYGAIHKEI